MCLYPKTLQGLATKTVPNVARRFGDWGLGVLVVLGLGLKDGASRSFVRIRGREGGGGDFGVDGQPQMHAPYPRRVALLPATGA